MISLIAISRINMALFGWPGVLTSSRRAPRSDTDRLRFEFNRIQHPPAAVAQVDRLTSRTQSEAELRLVKYQETSRWNHSVRRQHEFVGLWVVGQSAT